MCWERIRDISVQKKDSVVIFSAYMQEVNFKKFIIFNLFYLHLCFKHKVCIGNSTFRISGVLTWPGSVRNIVLLHTHTHIVILRHTSLQTFHTRKFGCVTVTKRDRPTFTKYCSRQATRVIVWQCHNSKFASRPSHRIGLGRRSNYPYAVCGPVLYFLCQF